MNTIINKPFDWDMHWKTNEDLLIPGGAILITDSDERKEPNGITFIDWLADKTK